MGIKIHEHTFESSGVTVKFRQVSTLVAVDVRASMEKDKPQPPMEEVELAGIPTEQPNEDDPDYIELMELYDQEVNIKINQAYAKRARLEFDFPNWKEEVAEYRALINDPEVLVDTDEWIFLTRVITAGNELKEFFDLLSSTAQPSQEAISAAKASFPA